MDYRSTPARSLNVHDTPTCEARSHGSNARDMNARQTPSRSTTARTTDARFSSCTGRSHDHLDEEDAPGPSRAPRPSKRQLEETTSEASTSSDNDFEPRRNVKGRFKLSNEEMVALMLKRRLSNYQCKGLIALIHYTTFKTNILNNFVWCRSTKGDLQEKRKRKVERERKRKRHWIRCWNVPKGYLLDIQVQWHHQSTNNITQFKGKGRPGSSDQRGIWMGWWWKPCKTCSSRVSIHTTILCVTLEVDEFFVCRTFPRLAEVENFYIYSKSPGIGNKLNINFYLPPDAQSIGVNK